MCLLLDFIVRDEGAPMLLISLEVPPIHHLDVAFIVVLAVVIRSTSVHLPS